MKSAVTVLQEIMIKLGLTSEYECISTGPQHQALFEYRCLACGEVATATARSKKEAKQEVARVMLHKLADKRVDVPAPFGLAGASTSAMNDDEVSSGSSADTRNYVELLKALCQEYRLATVEYELVGDTGPAHLRHFTMRARIGQHEQLATSTTKKAARHLAAEQLYRYLRLNLARLTRDFDEDEALARLHDKNTERHQDSSEDNQRRPRVDMNQKISEYHLGLSSRLDTESQARVVSLLTAERKRMAESPERVFEAAAKDMRLYWSYFPFEQVSGPPKTGLELWGCSPELVYMGVNRADAATQALRYMCLALDTGIDDFWPKVKTPEPITADDSSSELSEP